MYFVEGVRLRLELEAKSAQRGTGGRRQRIIGRHTEIRIQSLVDHPLAEKVIVIVNVPVDSVHAFILIQMGTGAGREIVDQAGQGSDPGYTPVP